MRVIAGTAKGFKLVSPKGFDTRPTADRIKESVFNIINAHLEGASFLDLFAGAGGIGIEALSRGAAKCVFVENGREAYNALLTNIEHTRLASRAETHLLSADAAVKMLGDKRERFDIVFMDPPYASAAEMDKLTTAISEMGLLAPNGFIIGEHGAEIDVSGFRNIEQIRRKNYGKVTAVSFWRLAPANGENE